MEENIVEFNKPGGHCPVVDVNGFISKGKQFDLDITLPEDNRDIIFGKVKNLYREPVEHAVVKLIEIEFGKDGKKRREPVTHTFTDKHGEFVLGPLCPGKEYAIDIWVDEVKHYDMDVKCRHELKCLKSKKSDKCEPK